MVIGDGFSISFSRYMVGLVESSWKILDGIRNLGTEFLLPRILPPRPCDKSCYCVPVKSNCTSMLRRDPDSRGRGWPCYPPSKLGGHGIAVELMFGSTPPLRPLEEERDIGTARLRHAFLQPPRRAATGVGRHVVKTPRRAGRPRFLERWAGFAHIMIGEANCRGRSGPDARRRAEPNRRPFTPQNLYLLKLFELHFHLECSTMAPPKGWQLMISGVLSVQKVLSGSGRATRRWPMYFPMRRSLSALPEPDNTFWTAST